jgi:hypothetical protein
VVDQHRARMIRPAMHDAMANRNGIYIELIAQPGARHCHRGRNIGNAFDRIGPIGQRIAVETAGPQPRPAADAIHLSLDLAPQPAFAFDREDLKLDAGGTGIDDEDRIHGDHAAAIGVVLRRASA